MNKSTKQDISRCSWPGTDPIYVDYHDQEWGRPIWDDRALWEKLILDGFQAGLSWITILKKRDNFIEAFDDFDPAVIAAYDERKVQALMQNKGIVRNQLKIRATITNAQAYLDMMEEQPFSDFLWSFVDGQAQVNSPRNMSEVRTTSPESDAMSKALKKRGFKFVGSTICYAFMQAVGIVNDHMADCFCQQECVAEFDTKRPTD
jgi:DNA-3-methyladenine glycosylase I